MIGIILGVAVLAATIIMWKIHAGEDYEDLD
jgi:hypothetical protein